jgi:fructuronate reductase
MTLPLPLHLPLHLPRLSMQTLGSLQARIARPAYDPALLPIGIVHFGPGAFHRAHQAAFIDTLCATDPRWGICGVSLQSAGVRDALAPQHGLYTLAVLDAQPSFRMIGSLREVLVAHEDRQAVFERLCRPAVQVVTTTVTEKGYCLRADGTPDLQHSDIVHDSANPGAPKSLIGYLVEGLRQRRAAGLPAFTLIPCDNLPANGRKLKAAVVALAAVQDATLAAWIDGALPCPNTMVDAITPATDDALRETVAAATGLHDAWPVQREAFAEWVIEAHSHPGGPDWALAGAVVTPDVAAFERAKLWLLNGPHSTLAYWGLLKGHETVAEGIADPELAAFLHAYMHEDIVPLLRAPGLDLHAYADAILARFANPAMRHLLSQIAQDGSQKLPVRVVAPMAEALARGADVSRFAVPLAAWLRFVRWCCTAGSVIADPLSAELRQWGMTLKDDASDAGRLMVLPASMLGALANDPRVRLALERAYAGLVPPTA